MLACSYSFLPSFHPVHSLISWIEQTTVFGNGQIGQTLVWATLNSNPISNRGFQYWFKTIQDVSEQIKLGKGREPMSLKLKDHSQNRAVISALGLCLSPECLLATMQPRN